MRKFRMLSALLVGMLLLSSCSRSAGSTAASDDSGLTTTEKTAISISIDEEKSYITDYLKSVISALPQYKFSVSYLPDNYGNAELQREIENGDTADIVISAHLSSNIRDIGTGMADLSSKSYTSQYKPAYLKDNDINGKIYFLPLSSIVEGIVYNKTLFDEKGWTLPTDYKEYQTLCRTIIDAGYGVIGSPLDNSNAGRIFSQKYMLDTGYQISSYHWLKEFNAQRTSIHDIDLTAAMNDLDDSSEFRKESSRFAKEKNGRLNVITEMATRSYAMMESGAFLINQLKDTADGDQFRLMPFYGSTGDSGYLFSGGTLQVGASAGSMNDPRKREAIDEIFTYLSSDKGQDKINAYTFNIIAPIISGKPQTDNDFFADVQTQLAQGLILNYDMPTRCEPVLNDVVAAYLNGAMDRRKLLDTIEEVNRNGLDEDETIATATESFSRDNMNALLLQVIQEQSGADLGIFYREVADAHIGNTPIATRYLKSVFYKGPVTLLDLSCCIQNTHYENYDPAYQPISIVKYTMTGKQILDLLEYGKDIYIGGGLTMIYKWNADRNTYRAAGFRLGNGKAFDLNAVYSAASLSLIPMEDGSYQKKEDTGIGYYKAVWDWLAKEKTISPSDLAEPVLEGK